MVSRSSNFTAAQIDLLLDSLEACPQLVSGKLDGKIPTKHHHRLAWEAVAQKINEIGSGGLKSGDQIRSKWHDMKYRVRQKASKFGLKFKETGKVPSEEETLTAPENRALSIMGWKSCKPLTNTDFDSTAISLTLLQPVNIIDFVIENSEETDRANTSENNATKETSDCLRTNNITQESLNESLKERKAVSENASDYDEPNKIIIQEIHSESSKGNESCAENATVLETSNCNWPYVANKTNNSTERSKAFRARKRKLIEEEEDSFEKRAITTQERMAADINEIKMSVIEMKNNMKTYMERIDQKFDKMLDLLAVALNVEPEELKK